MRRLRQSEPLSVDTHVMIFQLPVFVVEATVTKEKDLDNLVALNGPKKIYIKIVVRTLKIKAVKVRNKM